MTSNIDRHLAEKHYMPGSAPKLGTCYECPTWWEMTPEQRVAYARRYFHFGRG